MENKFTVKVSRLYTCPICKKQYKRKGYYLNKHLAKCNAIAWVPEVKCEVVFKQIHENDLAEAFETMINGNFAAPINRRKRANKSAERKCLPAFSEYKEKLENGGIKLKTVPAEELNHIYNIMVM